MQQEYFSTNQSLWNNKLNHHLKSDFYDLEGFKNGTYQPLKELELNAFPNVNDKTMLHLQCHFGQDSLSWARLGANVTGIDFSKNAIECARSLNQELGLNAKFVHGNVLDTRKYIQEQFDIVYTSYGVLCWLPDLKPWAKIISESLKPNGIFYIAEFHPLLMTYEFDANEFQYSYFNEGKPDVEIVTGTYTNRSADIHHKEYTWSHSISEVINPLLENGLELLAFNEYPFCTWNCFPNMKEVGQDRFVYTGFKRSMPHLFELKMRKVR